MTRLPWRPWKRKGGGPYQLAPEEITERYLPQITNFVAHHVRQKRDVEDLVADTVLGAVRGLHGYRGEAPPDIWLLGIAYRKIADHFRRTRRRREILAGDHAIQLEEDRVVFPWCTPAEGDPALRLEESEESERMRQILERLSPSNREFLVLRYVEDLEIEEIAAITGRTRKAVYRALERAREAAHREGIEYFQDRIRSPRRAVPPGQGGEP
jgi:RNA polymerase sigma-70 factor (ECF subfamily)